MLSKETYIQIGETVRSQILKEYTPASCIATARATMDLVKHLREDAYAVPVICMVANEVLWRYADEHGGYPEVDTPEYPVGAYGVGVGFGLEAEEGRWAGHLVVIAERKWLLDFSIDQANRPDYGITLGPVVIPISERWLRRTDEIFAYQAGNVRLHYVKRVGPEAGRFRESDNWSGETAPTVSIRRQDTGERRAERRRLIR